ncbi:MAG: PDZ domain-containing protein [Bacteroidales bacterium]|nr:PDZ domain-containing protein [Bacteroidales bacterium]
MKKLLIALISFTAVLSMSAAPTTEEARLLRFPAVGGGKIVFCYAGNLYSVDVNGGRAVKLTSDVGYECFPKISPDGKTVAFTAQYDGNTEVYTIPITGGEPKRLTYSALVGRDKVGERMGPNNIVMGWTPDGRQIVYRSKQWCFSGLRAQLCKVDVEGGLPEFIPTTEGGFCSYSPDGKKLAMNRMFREFRTWKYYRGGQADDIWINTVGTTRLERITEGDAQEIFPMWIGNEIYFLSDRDRTMNLFVYDTRSRQTRKVTDFTEYDCKFPAHSADGLVVFENGGYIYKYDVRKGAAEKVSIQLADDDVFSRSEYRSSGLTPGSVSLSPDGKRLVAVVRGDIFSLPAEKGPVVNVSRSPGSHEREAVWSPDGARIAWISDASDEYQIYTAPSDRMTEATCLTDFKEGYPSNLQWSPDGKKLYFSTLHWDVCELDADTKALTRILVGERSAIRSFTLSPDGSWAAYTETLPNFISGLYLFDLKARKSYPVTDRWYDASSPLFSRDGKYLFFTSSREFRSQYSAVEWNASYNVSDYVFVLPLTKDTPNPMVLGNDEYSAKKEEARPEGPRKDGPKETANVTRVDTDGLGQRITALPLDAGRYRLVLADGDKLYYSSFGGMMMGGGPRGGAAGGIKALDLKTLQTSDVPTSPLALTPDAKKALVRADGQLKVVSFGGPGGRGGSSVPVDEIDMMIDHEAEWAQIFDESWRITRDNFYVENMHGVDWDHMREKYGQMLPYVKHRDDLTYLIGEMIGELNVGHAYITSGESPDIPRIATGLLGGRYSKDSRTGAFKIEKIWRGADWDETLRCPLRTPGVDAKVGEYIVEVNGIPAKDLPDPGAALIGKAGKTVSLKIASGANGSGARTVYVKPVADESALAYYEWVQNNIEKVDKLSGGEIGYIHIPDMSTEGLDMFTKLFYTQLDKKALIIDDRMNGGGNVSPMILERLQREVYRMNMYRNGGNRTVPNETFYGPKVCLIDKYSSSDGDLFPYGFRQLGLGKLIGTRSWGGIVGISGSRQFVDGQDMRTPFFTSYSTDGEWIIEGHGVDPDIVVDINPFEDWLGKDAQLEKGVEYLKGELKNYKALPGTPAAPDKSK